MEAHSRNYVVWRSLAEATSIANWFKTFLGALTSNALRNVSDPHPQYLMFTALTMMNNQNLVLLNSDWAKVLCARPVDTHCSSVPPSNTERMFGSGVLPICSSAYHRQHEYHNRSMLNSSEGSADRSLFSNVAYCNRKNEFAKKPTGMRKKNAALSNTREAQIDFRNTHFFSCSYSISTVYD